MLPATLALLALALIMLASKPPQARSVGELPAPSAEVSGLIKSGQEVHAIRAYRRQTRASLLEACRVVRHFA